MNVVNASEGEIKSRWFTDEKGSTHKYNKKTNEYAIITKDGYVVTYYKPTNGYKYYKDQKKMKGKNNMTIKNFKPMECPICHQYFFSLSLRKMLLIDH